MIRRSTLSIATLGLAAAVAAAAVAAVAVTAAAAGGGPASSTLDPLALAHAQKIQRDVTARYVRSGGPRLVVTEASSTGVVESFRLLTVRLDEVRTVPAGNAVYFALCPVRATCPYPASRYARPAADFHPRRQALELALRTFLETSAAVVAVALPTPRFVLFIVERDELAREVDMPNLARALNGDPAPPPAAWLQRIVDQATRPRTFVFLGLVPGPGGGAVFEAMPRWPAVSLGSGG